MKINNIFGKPLRPWIIAGITMLLAAVILILASQSFKSVEETAFYWFNLLLGSMILIILLGFFYALAQTSGTSKVLGKEVQLKTAELTRSHNQLEMVSQIGALASSTLNLENVLEGILLGTLEASGASVGMIFLKDKSTGQLKWGSSIGLSDAFVSEYRERLIMPGEGLTGRISQTGETIYIPRDSSHDPRITRPVVKTEGLNSFIGVTLFAADEIVGVMNILTRPPKVLHEEDILLATAVGAYVGSAIRNAQLFNEIRKKEEDMRRFKFVSDNSSDAHFLMGRGTMFQYVNKTACEMVGYSGKELLKLGFPDVDIIYDRAKYQELFDLAQRKKVPPIESINKRKEGSVFPSEITFTGYEIDGKPYMFAALRDITERKKAGEQLLKEKVFTESVINSLPGVFYLIDGNGKFKRWNKRVEIITGYSGAEISKMTPSDFFAEEDKKFVEEKILDVFAKGEANMEADLLSKKGKKTPYYFTGIRITTDNIPYLIGVGIDISGRKSAEEQTLQSRHDWKDTFDTITDMITIHDKDFNIIRANKAADKILGLQLLKTDETKCFKYYHGTDHPPERCPSCSCLKTEKPATFEVFEPHLNRYIEIRAIPRFDSRNKLSGLIHIVRDITERKKIEDEIETAKAAWEMTFDNAKELIMLVDREFTVTRFNKSFAEFVSKPYDEIIGHKYTDFFPSVIINKKKTELLTNIEIQTETGHWLYLSCYPIHDENGKFLHTIIMATDISELKNTQQGLIQSQKELKKRINELEKFHKMAVGRELKMIDLKKEIKSLNNVLSKRGQS
ncbi:MAG TPA: PAS domain S-box protein [Nitrospirae bacterium]|nr:aerobic respiration control sensor protein ArcB [bacterium BMS3Abin10]GBE38241.1 aerobic respiration control sensor protein ArcB [bacterium BMS3Bbin08]HDH51803.1 PAS domain S-box protein [Nitrospirota bacterium]HDK81747.1 PAS domain S-box protein [Nitrospirota bacterium]